MLNRLEKFRAELIKRDLDAFYVASNPNRTYLSGFTGSAGILLVTLEQAYLLTDFRYVEQAKLQAKSWDIVALGKEPWQDLARVVKENKLKRLGFEKDHLSYSTVEKLKENLGQLELVGCEDIISELRAVKDDGEIELLSRAAALVDQAFAQLSHILKPGLKEREVALELEFFLRREGAEKAAFDFIVASGGRSALPHGTASEKVINQGEMITLDFGCVFQGYCSDITRTIFLGPPGVKEREIYSIVREAQEAAIEAVRPGVPAGEVDAVARRIIARAGYGDYFGHSLGHGVGMAVHEKPTLREGEQRVLEPGMVVTIEPGIYLPGFGGVRIEDMVLVTPTGCQVLTGATKDILSL